MQAEHQMENIATDGAIRQQLLATGAFKAHPWQLLYTEAPKMTSNNIHSAFPFDPIETSFVLLCSACAIQNVAVPRMQILKGNHQRSMQQIPVHSVIHDHVVTSWKASSGTGASLKKKRLLLC